MAASILYILLIVSLFIDSYKSNTTFYKYFYISSQDLALILLTIFFLIRIKYRAALHPVLQKINAYIVFPLTLVSSVGLTIWDYVTPANFVYYVTYIQYTQIYFIALVSGLVLFSQQNLLWFKKNYPRIVFLGGILLFLSALVANIFPFDEFIHLSQEDSLIEKVQYIVLLASLFLSYSIAILFSKHKEKIHRAAYLLIFMVLLFLLGEEISWGQRIFNIATPAYFAESNVQNEISIHNLLIFDRQIDIAYLSVALYGSFAWMIRKKISTLKNTFFDNYIPPWFFSPYFFIGSAFYIYNAFDQRFGYWDEHMELILYTGVCLFLLTLFLKIKKILPDFS